VADAAGDSEVLSPEAITLQTDLALVGEDLDGGS
jgi:hypothetical protein